MAFARTAISVTGTLTSGSSSITNVSNTTGLFTGMLVYGTGIPADTLISAISGTTVTMNRNATVSGTQTITGQYITQTGTDTSLAGLQGITGVTTIVSGTAPRFKAIYDLGTNQIRFQGTVTHDPDLETIVSGLQNGVRLESGTYNYGVETTINGKISYSKSCGFELTYGGALASNFQIQLLGAAFNWRGGIIRLAGAWSMSGGTFNQRGDTSVVSNINGGSAIQLRSTLPAANISYEKIRLAGVQPVFFWTTNTYSAISATMENGAIQTASSFIATVQSYDNFSFASNQAPADFYLNQLTNPQSTLSVIKNPDVIPRVAQLNTGAYGVVETRTALTFNMADSNGVSAANVVGYVKDSNNGARTNENQLTYTTDRTYIASSNTGGVLALGDVLVNVQMRNPSATNTVKHDYRSNYGNNSADFNIYLGGYEYLPTVTRQTLLGNGGRNVAWTMFDDNAVTLSRTAALALVGTKLAVDAATQTVTVLQSLTLSELYDGTKAFKYQGTQAAFETPSVTGLNFTASGDRLTGFTNWNLVVNEGATISPDESYREFALTGTGRVTNNGTINVPFRDVDGLRVTATGLDPEGFGITWYLRYKLTSAGTYTNISGTGNTALILLADGIYDIQVRAPGYDWVNRTLNTAEALSIDVGLRFQQAIDESPQYTKPFDEAVANIFQFNLATESVAVRNITGEVITGNFAEVYQATQRIMHLPDLVWIWENPIRANSVTQTITIPPGNTTSFFLTADSNNHVRLTCPVILQETGEAAYDRVRGNADGFLIILGSPATAESAGLVDQVVRTLGGDPFDQANATQNALREALDQLRAVTDLIKARTDLVPDEPATSAEVTALGTPLQAADYVVPATAEEIAVQVELAIINEDDGREVIKAIADKIKAEEVTATVIAETVRQELAPELANIDAPISSRSTLTAEDIPATGLTPEQEAALAKIDATTSATFGQVGKLTN